MTIFTKHTDSTAPKGAAEVLGKVKERYGFVPNLAAYIAESPLVLDMVMNMSGAFDKTSFTPQEQQIILATVSVLNDCNYCRTAHTALSRKAGMDDKTLKAVLDISPLPDKKQNALRDFTKALVEERGWAGEEKVNAFLSAGYAKAQVFEVVLGIALKTLTNYSNHLAGAEPNREFVMMAEGKAAA